MRPTAPPIAWADAGTPASRSVAVRCPYVRVAPQEIASIASHTRLWKSVPSGARGTLAGEGASPAKYPSSQATAASRACASASSHSAGARTTSRESGEVRSSAERAEASSMP